MQVFFRHFAADCFSDCLFRKRFPHVRPSLRGAVTLLPERHLVGPGKNGEGLPQKDSSFGQRDCGILSESIKTISNCCSD